VENVTLNTKPATFVVSLDFELIWGVRDFADVRKADSLLVTRQVVPALLELFKRYEIHATWATVGFLFFESRAELLNGLPQQVPGYVNRSLSPYEDLHKELGEDEVSDPLHYAPSLIRQIVQTPHQELATHTFSHYYCLEAGQTPDDFENDLRAALRAARRFDHEIKSIVFPRNQYAEAYVEVCARNGIQAYRGTERVWFRQSSKREAHRQWQRRLMRLADAYLNISGANSYPAPVDASLPVNLPSSRYLRAYSKRLEILEPLRLQRIQRAMTVAARAGEVFHLWWHPEDFSTHTADNLRFLERILEHYQKLKRAFGMDSLSMSELAAQIESQRGPA
jgi:peptidoglycan/xylan/chitin deacetylase (PgdA/CDA1 family)